MGDEQNPPLIKVSLYKIPGMIEAFQADKGWFALIGFVWLLWFGYFIPEKKDN
ncbi:hypothetical protein [Bacillus nitratireducens]|uniref:hypothetical protein n=1 Tax=Bacillus nitratireducens TaxID=2026193 RepID=UPI002E1BEC95|nr:hypothetical protein [Bacillus nitratireducens]